VRTVSPDGETLLDRLASVDLTVAVVEVGARSAQVVGRLGQPGLELFAVERATTGAPMAGGSTDHWRLASRVTSSMPCWLPSWVAKAGSSEVATA